jgi:hypothetical protein
MPSRRMAESSIHGPEPPFGKALPDSHSDMLGPGLCLSLPNIEGKLGKERKIMSTYESRINLRKRLRWPLRGYRRRVNLPFGNLVPVS